MKPVVSRLNGLRRVDPIPSDPQSIAECNRVSVGGQLIFDLIVDRVRRHVRVAAVAPLDCRNLVHYCTMHFVPFICFVLLAKISVGLSVGSLLLVECMNLICTTGATFPPPARRSGVGRKSGMEGVMTGRNYPMT